MPKEPQAGAGGLGAADPAKQGHGAELAVDDSGGLQLPRARRIHPGGEVSGRRADLVELFTRTIDFEFSDRRATGAAPMEHVLAAAFRVPENLVSLCLAWKNEVTDGEPRCRASSLAPGLGRPGLGRGLHRRDFGQMLP